MNISLIDSSHLKHTVLGEGRRQSCALLQQIFFGPVEENNDEDVEEEVDEEEAEEEREEEDRG